MEQEQFLYENIYNGTDTITLNTTPTTLVYTNPLPANINIPDITNAFDLFKLDTEIANLMLGVLSVFIMVINLQSYFKIVLMLIVGIFICPNIVYGFIYAFSLFAAGELASGKWIYTIVLAIILIHVLIRSRFMTIINSSSVNIDWLFVAIEAVVLVVCIFVPLFTNSNKIDFTKMTNENPLSILETMYDKW